jgi:hypothetical protein
LSFWPKDYKSSHCMNDILKIYYYVRTDTQATD